MRVAVPVLCLLALRPLAASAIDVHYFQSSNQIVGAPGDYVKNLGSRATVRMHQGITVSKDKAAFQQISTRKKMGSTPGHDLVRTNFQVQSLALNYAKPPIPMGSRAGQAGDGHKGHAKWSDLARLGALVAGTAPVFSVIDHNSAHTFTAALATAAFQRSPQPGRTAVLINVDNHSDFTNNPIAVAGVEAHVRCDNWVDFAKAKAPVAKFFHFGTHGVPEQQKLQQLQTELAADKKIDLYLSVDRDFMIGSCTPWGNGPYTSETGRALITKILDAFHGKDLRIVGFDVVGLPNTETVKDAEAQCADRTASVARANEDIKAFFAAFASRPWPGPWPMPTAGVRGGITKVVQNSSPGGALAELELVGPYRPVACSLANGAKPALTVTAADFRTTPGKTLVKLKSAQPVVDWGSTRAATCSDALPIPPGGAPGSITKVLVNASPGGALAEIELAGPYRPTTCALTNGAKDVLKVTTADVTSKPGKTLLAIKTAQPVADWGSKRTVNCK